MDALSSRFPRVVSGLHSRSRQVAQGPIESAKWFQGCHSRLLERTL